MKKNNILIVDDDPNIREVLSVLLTGEGFHVKEAEDGKSALETIRSDKKIDLIILDIMMPGMSGIEVCCRLRRSTRAPVLFLTAKSQDQDKVEAYVSGGDDYLVKPFSKIELLMKVKSLLRRYKQYRGEPSEEERSLIGENIFIDGKTRSALKDGRKIPLTDKEFDILRYLTVHRGKTVENRDLYEGVWEEKYLPSAGNTIMVHILNLRKKLEENPGKPQIIKTVWGKGYKIE